jgi:hypothetical protein
MQATEIQNGSSARTSTPDGSIPAGRLSGLVSGIVDDAQRLLHQQVHMIRAEFQEDMQQTKWVAQAFGVAGVLFALGIVLIMFSLVHLLLALFPQMPEAAAWAIIGGISLLLGGLSLFIGIRIMNAYNPLPDKSFRALTENLSWITRSQK